ncbi:molybdopterin-dependent oxidoreductase [Micromonospora sp. WMMA1363]|uniref:molybdopterin-dependent oxidoreductase n=1 Tax=Micromonospora sp. WMMA1363 TaxID=3053985 RepID=UPI00259CD620|nr:molybdopterin-dependent oxidoreductase [Micromonospora sp. WMMA1363]MDM4720376.1 molybdopterin-dependent oxidoreductase [Micromonospora sp. WMMA1363]
MTDDAAAPGQRPAALERFGLPAFARRRVVAPREPVLMVTGEVAQPRQVALAELTTGLPRTLRRADLHCVTTWSAVGLCWEGVPFSLVLDRLQAACGASPQADWLLLTGLDGFQACLAVEDARAEDVLLADRLDGRALTGDHGAPVRVVAPGQYGYKSVKHLAVVEFHVRYAEGSAGWREHPRGRVDREERSRVLPGPVWRWVWRRVLPASRRPYRGSDGAGGLAGGADEVADSRRISE